MHAPYTSPGSLYSPLGLRKYLTPDERKRFIAAALRTPRAEVRTLCLTIAHTGCRISEALALVASSIVATDGFIAFRSLKKRGERVVIREVPTPAELLDELSRTHGLGEAHPSHRLWHLCRTRAWQLIKAVMADAGIAEGIHATPKGLRHGFGLHALRSGISINLVQRWLGHASLATTAIYLQAMGAEERALAMRMWERVPCVSKYDELQDQPTPASLPGLPDWETNHALTAMINGPPAPFAALPCCQCDTPSVGRGLHVPIRPGNDAGPVEKMEFNMTAVAKESNRPSHAIWQVIGDGDAARWIRVGAAWPNRDGKGFSLKFDAYPVVGNTVIREITEKSDSQVNADGN